MLREHIESFNQEKNVVVVSFSRTMHTYLNILKQLALSFEIDVPDKGLEKALIQTAFEHVRNHKTLYTLID